MDNAEIKIGHNRGKAYFQVGGGIVYDSEPEAEYEETLHKARALIEALDLSSHAVVEAKQ